MNHELILQQVRMLAENSTQASSDAARVQYLFHRILQRDARPFEVSDALNLVASTELRPEDGVRKTVADWRYGYGEVDETTYSVAGFEQIPHFTGTSWQGGPKWPDEKLGWVSLTAVGGHPGNTRQHACVRRWTAPRDMTIRIESKLTHEPAPGDGIRAFVLAPSGRKLYAGKLHQQTVDINADSIPVKEGEAVDFVVDIDNVLNSDQFLWKIDITDSHASVRDHSHWNSEADFTRDTMTQLSPWEQLVHVLLCTNEFLFVD